MEATTASPKRTRHPLAFPWLMGIEVSGLRKETGGASGRRSRIGGNVGVKTGVEPQIGNPVLIEALGQG
jgi:hypothetical protein